MAFLSSLLDAVFGKPDPEITPAPTRKAPPEEPKAESLKGEKLWNALIALTTSRPIETQPLEDAPAPTSRKPTPRAGNAGRRSAAALPKTATKTSPTAVKPAPKASVEAQSETPTASARDEFRDTWVTGSAHRSKPKRASTKNPAATPEKAVPKPSPVTVSFSAERLIRNHRKSIEARAVTKDGGGLAVAKTSEVGSPVKGARRARDMASELPLVLPDASVEADVPKSVDVSAPSEAVEGPPVVMDPQIEADVCSSVDEATPRVAEVQTIAPDRPARDDIVDDAFEPSERPDAILTKPLLNFGRQQHDPLLTDLVRLNPTRVRLENALLNGDTAGTLPHQTVLAYVRSPDARGEFMRSVSNFGRLSADELESLVIRAHRQLVTRQMGIASGGVEVLSTSAIRRAVVLMFAGRDTDDVLAPYPVPARLQNALFLNGLLALPFPEFLLDFPQRAVEILRQANVGRGSVEAGRGILRRIVSTELSSRGVATWQAEALLACVFDGRELTQPERLAASIGLAAKPEGVDFEAMAPVEVVSGDDPLEVPVFDSDGELIVAVAELFGDASVSDLVYPMMPPARLENVLRTSGWAERPFQEVLVDFPREERVMLRMPNMGRTSLDAWRKIAARLLEARLSRLELSRQAIDDCIALVLQGRELTAIRRRAIAIEMTVAGQGASAHDVAARVAAIEPEPARTSEALLAPLLASLEDRAQDVMNRRYGLDGQTRETLEQISQTYELTRERIRQIESKALRMLRLQTHGEIQRSVDLDGDAAWRAMTDGPLIMLGQLARHRRRIPRWFELALDVAKLDFQEWLDTYAQRATAGWVAPSYDLDRLHAIRPVISARSASDRTPYAIQSIDRETSGLDVDDIRLACELEGLRLYGDYVVSGWLGSRARRTVQIHAMLSEVGEAIDVGSALSDYARRFPGDACSARDLEIVMSEHPKLFLEVWEGVWCAIGPSGRAPDLKLTPAEIEVESETEEITLEPEDAAIAAPDEETIAEAVVAELRRAGPQRISVLMDRAPDYLPKGRSGNSVGPILLHNKDLFARPLPGVYALHDQVLSDDRLLQTKPAYLFDERHVRNYVVARNAGEPFGAYALWIPAVEYLWCHWARRHADTALLEALLSVADPDAWPDVEDREDWRALQAQRGRYTLHVSPRDEAYGLPNLEHVLSACLLIRQHGRLSWTSGNRAQFRRPADHTSAGLLAFLVAINALETGVPHWQVAHLAGSDLADVLERLECERVQLGVLVWTGEAGQALIRKARAFVPSQGWVTSDRVSRLIGEDQAVDTARKEMSEPPSADFLDQLLAEQSERHDADRLAGVLAELSQGKSEAGR